MSCHSSATRGCIVIPGESGPKRRSCLPREAEPPLPAELPFLSRPAPPLPACPSLGFRREHGAQLLSTHDFGGRMAFPRWLLESWTLLWSSLLITSEHVFATD